jgi:hypothetical protein
MEIPKLFFFDACRGKEWLHAAPDRGSEEEEFNYRIDYATIRNHKVPATSRWMQQVAKTLREEKDMIFSSVMRKVRRDVRKDSGTYIQLPETAVDLVEDELKLWYKREASA